MGHRIASIVAAAALILAAAAAAAQADPILTVGGSGADYTTVTAAVTYANTHAGYFTIEIAPGTYVNEFPVVNVPMTIEAETPGTVILKATEPPSNLKGIITTNASTTISGLTIEGANITSADPADSNGAGIRDQTGTASLVINDDTFLDDQNGILGSGGSTSTVTISGSTFMSDGYDAGDFTCPANGCDHAVYIGVAGSLSISSSAFCGTLVGHDIKSRAATTTITGNQLYDGASDPALGCPAGSTSFAIDLPNGGDTTIADNIINQGPATQNGTMVSYGEEGLTAGYDNQLLVENNTFINTASGNSIGVNNHTASVEADLQCNSFIGVAQPLSGPGTSNNANCATLGAPPLSSVPEPNGLTLVGMGIIGFNMIRRRYRLERV